jgi:serine/threonine protein kinase
MEIDLHKVISKSNQVLSEEHIKCLMKQLLEGLKAMHSVGIFHRDIKPANILVNQDCQLRITDFGMARVMTVIPEKDVESSHPMTEYVVTRWYRAPEVLLAPSTPYDEAIDMWSAGCILAELVIRQPIFAGRDYIDQLNRIFSVVGFRDARELGFPINATKATFLNSKCKYLRKPFSQHFPALSTEGVHVLESLLVVNPKLRSTAAQALSFPFFADAEILFDYSNCNIQLPSPDYFDFENGNYDSVVFADIIRSDVANFNASTAKKLDSSPAVNSHFESEHTCRTSTSFESTTSTIREDSFVDVDLGQATEADTYSISVFPGGHIGDFRCPEKSCGHCAPPIKAAVTNPFSNQYCSSTRSDRLKNSTADIPVNNRDANSPKDVASQWTGNGVGDPRPPAEECTEQGNTSSMDKFSKMKGLPTIVRDVHLHRCVSSSAAMANVPTTQLAATSLQRGNSLQLPQLAQPKADCRNLNLCSNIFSAVQNTSKHCTLHSLSKRLPEKIQY